MVHPGGHGISQGDGRLRASRRLEPFLDGGEGTILDHLLAVVRFAGANLGPHGLPIFGRGDWNDTLDYIGGKDGGESVWGGMFTVAMLDRLLELLDLVKAGGRGAGARGLRDRLVEALEAHAWDGEWYIRAFGEAGSKIGSKENAAGRIFINTQSWAVIAGLPDRARLVRAMDSLAEHLDTPYGPKICAPAFREIDPTIGLITRCVRGKKENGAVFCHPAAWVIQAECLLGRGERAFAYFKKLLPGRIARRRSAPSPMSIPSTSRATSTRRPERPAIPGRRGRPPGCTAWASTTSSASGRPMTDS